MHKIFLIMSRFYALVGSAECWSIQILTICYFNSFFFRDAPYVGLLANEKTTTKYNGRWVIINYSIDQSIIQKVA
jgi:hypothetical protein